MTAAMALALLMAGTSTATAAAAVVAITRPRHSRAHISWSVTTLLLGGASLGVAVGIAVVMTR